MHEEVITLLMTCSCLIFSACYAGGSGYSSPSRNSNQDSDWEWELNTNTSELEYCIKRGITRTCL